MKVGDATKNPQSDIRTDIDNCLAAAVNNLLSFWRRWLLGLTMTGLVVASMFIFTNRHGIFGTCPSGWRNERHRGLGCLCVHIEDMRVDQAEQFCHNLNSHLLEIYSREQLNITRTMLMEIMEEEEMKQADWYTGGTDMDSGDHVFTWPQVCFKVTKHFEHIFLRQADEKIADWIWPPGHKISHNWACVTGFASKNTKLSEPKPCCDTDPVSCEDNFVALRSSQDLFAMAIPLDYKYQYDAKPICQMDAF